MFGLFKKSADQILSEMIDFNSERIAKEEQCSKDEADLIAICLLLDDMFARSKGKQGFTDIMTLVQKKYSNRYPYVMTYLMWLAEGKIISPACYALLRMLKIVNRKRIDIEANEEYDFRTSEAAMEHILKYMNCSEQVGHAYAARIKTKLPFSDALKGSLYTIEFPHQNGLQEKIVFCHPDCLEPLKEDDLVQVGVQSKDVLMILYKLMPVYDFGKDCWKKVI